MTKKLTIEVSASTLEDVFAALARARTSCLCDDDNWDQFGEARYDAYKAAEAELAEAISGRVRTLSDPEADELRQHVNVARLDKLTRAYNDRRPACIRCGSVEPCEHTMKRVPTREEIIG